MHLACLSVILLSHRRPSLNYLSHQSLQKRCWLFLGWDKWLPVILLPLPSHPVSPMSMQTSVTCSARNVLLLFHPIGLMTAPLNCTLALVHLEGDYSLCQPQKEHLWKNISTRHLTVDSSTLQPHRQEPGSSLWGRRMAVSGHVLTTGV